MLIPAGYCQINLRFGGLAAPEGSEVTMAAENIGDLSPESIGTIVAGLYVTSGLYELQSQQITLDEVLVKLGPNSTGAAAVTASGQPGNGPTNALPPNTAVIIRKNTGTGGRTGRGRIFWPGFWEAAVDAAGIIDAVILPDFVTNFEAFRQDMITASLPLALLHAPGSPISAPLPITDFSVSNKVATQRRRLRR